MQAQKSRKDPEDAAVRPQRKAGGREGEPGDLGRGAALGASPNPGQHAQRAECGLHRVAVGAHKGVRIEPRRQLAHERPGRDGTPMPSGQGRFGGEAVHRDVAARGNGRLRQLIRQLQGLRSVQMERS